MSSGYPTDETLPASRAIDIARWATIVATCSVMVSPPLANAAMAVMLIGLLASGQAGVRLRQACTQPLGIATLLLISVIGVAMLWGDAPWRDRWAAFWSWRKLWMIPVALALFGPLYWKRRLAVAYVAVCGVAMIASFVLVAIEGRLPTMYELALSGSLLRNHSAQSMAFATAAFVALWLAADPLLAARLAAVGRCAGRALRPEHGVHHAGPQRLSGACGHARRAGRVQSAQPAYGAGGARAGGDSRGSDRTVATGARSHQSGHQRMEQRLDPDLQDVDGHARSDLRQHAGTSPGATVVRLRNRRLRRRRMPRRSSGKYSDDWRAVPTVDPHSQYLFFLAEQGIFGLLAFLGFIAAALADRGDSTRARIIAVGMLLGWCATSLVSSHFKTFSEGHLLTFFLGAMLARPVTAPPAPLPRARLSPS